MKKERNSDDIKALRSAKISERNVLIDNFKGVLTLLYMAVHVIIHMDKTADFTVPAWVGHSNPVVIAAWGFNPIDLGPILFFFVIGFVLFDSFNTGYAKIGAAAYKRVFIRNAAFLGVFLGLMFIAGLIGGETSIATWNTVPSIGFTGLLAVPFLSPRLTKSAWGKLACAAAVTVFYYFARDVLFKYLAAQKEAHAGGMAACVGYLGIVLLAGFIRDISKKGFLPYAALTAALWLAGRYVYLIDTPSFPQLNAVYMFSALSKVNLAYFIFYTADKLFLKNRPIPLIAAMGRNIMLFLFLILAVQAAYALFEIFPAANMTDGWIRVGVVGAIYLLAAIPLEKKKITFKL
ncbi:MAG: hypothetical protein LBT30_07815 [Clostridiales bacterium]|jgi:hypothetical protein|nr:hypothetical protein [Clostridiales bacterium]